MKYVGPDLSNPENYKRAVEEYNRRKQDAQQRGVLDDGNLHPDNFLRMQQRSETPVTDPNDFLAQILAEKTSIAGGFPMSREEFDHEVTKRMDRGKDVQQVLREQFGVNSIIEGIQKGIFPAPPLRGV